MSFLVPKVDTPAANRTTQARVSTWREAEPLPFGNGFFRVAPKWITDRFNDHWSNGSQTGQAYCSVAGLLCHGPVDYCRCILRSGTTVALLDIQRSDTPGPGYYYTSFEFGGSDPQLGVANKGRIYWGREDQPADSWLRTMTGQQHPPYRGQCYVVFERLHCGQIQAKSQARPALPSIEFSLVRLVSPTVPSGLRLPASIGAYKFRGVNPVSAHYDLLTHRRGGLGLVGLLDDADWVAKAAALEAGTKSAGGVYGPDIYIAPLHTGGAEAEQLVADYLSYIDGFFTTAAGKLRIDWFPNDGTVPEDLPEITHHDLERGSVPEIRTDALAEAPSQVVVACLDGFHDGDDLTEAAETAAVPFVRELTGGENRVKKIERPWFIVREIARGYAQRYASTLTVPGQEGSMQVLLSRAVRLDGTPLRPGDLCRLNWPDLSLLLVVRITERRDRGRVAELKWQRERGITPLPYAAAPDPRTPYELPAPSTPGTTDWAIAEAPPGMRDRAVVAFVRRVQDTLSHAILHLDEDGDWGAGATELAAVPFSPRAELDAGIAAGDATIDIAGTDIDLSPVLGSGCTSAEQADDTLVAVIGSEWLSIGSVTSIAADTYRLGVLRGRWQTTAAAASGGAAVWIARRADLPVLLHAVFGASTTRYFKVQVAHTLATSALSAAKSVAFRSGTPAAPSGLSASTGVVQAIFLRWTKSVDTDVAEYEIFESATTTQPGSPSYRVTADAFTVGGYAGGETRYFWVRARDTAGNVSSSIGPATGTALEASGGTQGPPGEDGDPGVFGAITHNNTLAWVKAADGGSWTPGTATTTLTCTFRQGGTVLATRTIVVTLDTGAGTLSAGSGSGAGVTESIAGAGTAALSITFTHTASGAAIGAALVAARGGSTGSTGSTGSPGTNAALARITHNNTLAWVRYPDAGVWAPNSSGTTLTCEIVRNGSTLASRTLDIAFSSGLLSATAGTVSGITAAVAGNGTAALTITFTDTVTGAATTVLLTSTQGGATGAPGGTGPQGDYGPGPVIRGDYSASGIYFHTARRRDIVRHAGTWWMTNNAAKSGLATWSTPGTADWDNFGSELSSVATALLLAEDATIARTLVMGDGATAGAGVIRSNGATAYGTGTGYWLNPRNGSNLPEFRVGDPAGARIAFDGSTLSIQQATLETNTGANAVRISPALTRFGYGTNNFIAIENQVDGGGLGQEIRMFGEHSGSAYEFVNIFARRNSGAGGWGRVRIKIPGGTFTDYLANGLQIGAEGGAYDVDLTRASAGKLKTSADFDVGSYFGIAQSNGTAQTGTIQVGGKKTGNRFALVDLFADDTYEPTVTGPALRLMRWNNGANSNSDLTHRGTGDLRLIAQDSGGRVAIYTANTLRCTFRDDGIYNAAGTRVVAF